MGFPCRALLTHRVRGHSFIRLYKRESREPLSHDMVQCGFAVAGYPTLDSVPPGPDYPAPAPVAHAPLTVVVPGVPPPLLPSPAATSPLPPRGTVLRPMHLEVGTWYR